MTFDGLRSGEGYFSADGSLFVFQSERDPSNPFYQIYLQDLNTGDVKLVSPGFGKTTCGWIHPDNKRVMYASTQFDPAARDKMKAELEFRASGQKKSRYSWDYDPEYELVMWDSGSGAYTRITNTLGYDAEGAISPDGKSIVFASNRRAYSGELTAAETELFKLDPASAMDIYIMDIDGSNIRRLTEEIGYDGGPFFSPDGKRICWRHFAENGLVAEIYTMAIDGSDVKRLTSMQCVSWAPFYHPSGDYIAFTTNKQGFGNFEIYIVDTQCQEEPVRVTYTDGFDGLPVFSPDGARLTWASNRTPSNQSQIFSAKWSDSAAREALHLNGSSDNDLQAAALSSAQAAVQSGTASFKAADIGRHIDYLCRPELGGRLTGTPGEIAASSYVAAYLEQIGCTGAMENEVGIPTFTQPFPFVSGIQLGKGNELHWNDQSYVVDQDWRPLSLSSDTSLKDVPIVFAGYGIVAPEGQATGDQKQEHFAEYDSYVHLDVKDKWVLVFRQMPMDIAPERRSYLARFSSLRYKAMMARERGAAGLIVVSGPTSESRSQLVPLTTDGSLSGSQIAAISVKDAVAAAWFKAAGKDVREVQKSLDSGEPAMGYEVQNVKLSATVDVDPISARGVNTAGLLKSDEENAPTIIIGAHIDHLGSQAGNNSLAREDERNGIHRGADDNASGVAGMLEIAQYLSDEVKNNRLKLKANVIFAAWSGEELGLLGSAYFAEHLPSYLMNEEEFAAYMAQVHGGVVPSGGAGDANSNDAKTDGSKNGVGQDEIAHAQPPRTISACFNLDMIGRLRDNLVLQGTGSSPIWRSEIEQRNSIVGLSLVLQDDSYLPTDATTFYQAGIPILSAFTGQHGEYHTPRDVPELINFEGAAQTARLMGLIVRSLAASGQVPEFVLQKRPENSGTRAVMTAYLGTIPDYTTGDLVGVKLSDVTPGAPAANVGVKGGDIIIELAGRKVANIYDYTFAIEALKVGEATTIVVKRGDQELKLDITPASRQ
jgi:Tol biopolymer transport system component